MVYLYGASGHAKVVIEILEASGVLVEALFDDNPDIRSLLGYKVLGSLDNRNLPEQPFIITIGKNSLRHSIVQKHSLSYASAIHPTATISKRVKIGVGSVVMGHAIINADTVIGKHAIVNTSASIDHDCMLDDFVHISPNATLSGSVQVGLGTHIGSGAVVAPNIHIGKWAMIGAGAAVFRDVPDYATVVGNPGRIVKTENPKV